MMTLFLIGCLYFMLSCTPHHSHENMNDMITIALPEFRTAGDVSIEESMQKRRSIREYSDAPLTLDDIGQLAWSAQGITDPVRNYRTAPSAGATFPVEIYFILTKVPDAADGLYRYQNENHSLQKIRDGDLRPDLYNVALQQDAITNAPVAMVITGVLSRIEPRYRDRALRYMYMEAGHVAQNVYLQSVPLSIGTVVIGAFEDNGVRDVLGLDEGEYPMYIMPLGKRR